MRFKDSTNRKQLEDHSNQIRDALKQKILFILHENAVSKSF